MAFGAPYLLSLIALVPAIVFLARWTDRRPSRHAVAFTNLDVLASVLPAKRRARRWLPLLLFLLTLVATITAIARPYRPARVVRDHATVVLLVDVSGSMSAADIKPTRLAAAQAAMKEFARRVPDGVNIGLVGFNSSPFVLVSPTVDRDRLVQAIDELSPDGGTAIGDGLRVAVELAESSSAAGRDSGELKRRRRRAAIVLLSDGAQTKGALEPMQGAELARAAGVRVDTIALGTNRPAHGDRAVSEESPDPATLAAIASLTGGETFYANTAARAFRIYRSLGSDIVRRSGRLELASWFSGAAALLLIATIVAAWLELPVLP